MNFGPHLLLIHKYRHDLYNHARLALREIYQVASLTMKIGIIALISLFDAGFNPRLKALYLAVFLLVMVGFFRSPAARQITMQSNAQVSEPSLHWWEFQAIDTMKLSRDLAREKLNDASFNSTISTQVRLIKETGATHIVIATPYDEEFLPFMRRWVRESRDQGLLIWFRGNFSGWEGWFSYPDITRETHTQKIKDFILRHPDLFEDGDVFTSCPECENGGPGDPRMNGDVDGYKAFLIADYKATQESFDAIGKKVQTNFYSMNGDVARLIMDKQTTAALGGFVTIDHYVKTSAQMKKDLADYVTRSNGSIVIGEFGAPVPDIHGNMSPDAQAQWIDEMMEVFVENPSVMGLNYWVGSGGSTQLWDYDGTNIRPAVEVLKKHFLPEVIQGTIQNEIDEPIKDARITIQPKEVLSAANGQFMIPVINATSSAVISADGYETLGIPLTTSEETTIVLKKTDETILFKIQKFLKNIFPQFLRTNPTLLSA